MEMTAEQEKSHEEFLRTHYHFNVCLPLEKFVKGPLALGYHHITMDDWSSEKLTDPTLVDVLNAAGTFVMQDQDDRGQGRRMIYDFEIEENEIKLKMDTCAGARNVIPPTDKNCYRVEGYCNVLVIMERRFFVNEPIARGSYWVGTQYIPQDAEPKENARYEFKEWKVRQTDPTIADLILAVGTFLSETRDTHFVFEAFGVKRGFISLYLGS